MKIYKRMYIIRVLLLLQLAIGLIQLALILVK